MKPISQMTAEELEALWEEMEAKALRQRMLAQNAYDRKVRQPKAAKAKAERLAAANRLAQSLIEKGREDLV